MRHGASVAVLAALLAACGPSDTGVSVAERARQSSAAAGPVSAKIISEDDLPPEGTRSLFDHLLAQNDGLKFPFEKLIALVQSQDPENRPPVSLMIPFGRSLLKASADFAHPRVLVAADYQAPGTAAALGFAPRGQLFLGFVENAHEIEVISYNEAAGRYEFQLVQNYCEGCVPRIVYARRAICTTCHQGGTPIFPQRPWNETNGQPEIAAKISAARGPEAYLGLPVVNALSAPERFDELTDVGAFRVAAQRAWLDGCGDNGADCRRQMLKVALKFGLNPGRFDANDAEAKKLRELQTKSWPKDGVTVPESDLRNRDPLAEQRGVRGFFRALFARKTDAPGAKNNEDLDAFDKLPKLPAALDPVVPRAPKRILRADDLDGAFALAQFLTDADFKRLEQAAGYDSARLLQAVDRLDPEFLRPAAFARIRTMRALLLAMKQPGGTAYCCLDVSEMSPPIAAGVPPLALRPDSPLKNFETYCFACHRGNPARRLNFMDGKTEDEVLAHIKDKPEIRDALDWARYRGTDKESKLMPPADSHQHAALVAAQAQNPQLLEEMRKLVPGLFDF